MDFAVAVPVEMVAMVVPAAAVAAVAEAVQVISTLRISKVHCMEIIPLRQKLRSQQLPLANQAVRSLLVLRSLMRRQLLDLLARI